jgi:hypothetical protein
MASDVEMPNHQYRRERQGCADDPAAKILDVMIARALDHVGPADVIANDVTWQPPEIP